MTNAPHASSSPIDLTPARVAREVYDAAVTAPNVTPLTWAGIAVEMQRTAQLMRLAGVLPGFIEAHEARARDAANNAVAAALKVRDAQTRRIIDMATIGGASVAAVLANGLSRHGAHCSCRGCRAIYAPNGLTRGHQVDCECSICVAVRAEAVAS